MMQTGNAEPVKPSEEMVVSFSGPFSWPGTSDAPSVFDAEVRRLPGIYLWTVSLAEGHLVYYVGETGRSFEVRLLEHYKEHAACMYHVYSPAELARGEKVALWPGRYDAEHRKFTTEFIAQHANLAPHIHALAYLYRFLLAPLSCESRIRQRIEAAIAGALYAAPGLAGIFQDRGIRYAPRRADEVPLGCALTSPVPLIGLPEQIWA